MKVKLYPETNCTEDNPLALFLLNVVRGERPVFVQYEEAEDEHNLTNLDEARALVVEATINYMKKHEL